MRYLLLLMLVYAGCASTQMSSTTKVGEPVHVAYFIDANTGFCVGIREMGKIGQLKRVAQQWCEGRALKALR